MRILLSVCSVLALVVGSGAAYGATICVNPGGTAGCRSSIQAAVDAAVADDVVDVASGTYAESITVSPSRQRLTIQGAGAGLTIVDGSALLGAPVITVGDVSGGRLAVALRGISVQLGLQTGILVKGGAKTRATIEDVELSGVIGYPSSAIQVGEEPIKGSSATIARVKIHQVGIPLYATSAAKVTLVDSEISDSGPGGFQARTGGLVAFLSARIVADRVLLAGMSGRIVDASRGGRVSLTSSTISSNHAPSFECLGSASSIKLTGCTIAENDSLSFVSGGMIRLAATIVWGTATPPDCTGRLSSGDFNMLESSCGFARLGRHDRVQVDPLLGPLENNGGPTDTHALLPSSPARNVVSTHALCKASDQRGVARSVPCDVGAFEAP